MNEPSGSCLASLLLLLLLLIQVVRKAKERSVRQNPMTMVKIL